MFSSLNCSPSKLSGNILKYSLPPQLIPTRHTLARPTTKNSCPSLVTFMFQALGSFFRSCYCYFALAKQTTRTSRCTPRYTGIQDTWSEDSEDRPEVTARLFRRLFIGIVTLFKDTWSGDSEGQAREYSEAVQEVIYRYSNTF